MKKIRIAVPTNGHKGMNDTVSGVFSRAKTFTIINMEDGNSTLEEILVNEAAELSQGAGPMAVKILKDKKVNIVISSVLGPGASTLLDTVNIKAITVPTEEKVSEAIKQI
jgi:predicted Fe-Mo cluster-binding NifX family protein